ncbi:MAG: hypothetical protein JWR33_2524 [Naasia sp.]|jgi:hypothetical protein|uniref:hypothetical protein n=1 Tax=Naasia sp. TaxID=2546198 RepID=UPI002608B8AD|nr:hypothetical protein [Naasia sp.]MCU1571783.1 hypothetical protein [Naasia sp.]
MSKKVDNASRALRDAVKEHARLLSRSKTRPEKLERAAWKLRAAALAYTQLVLSRTGTTSPFVEIPDPQLEDASVSTLTAERDRLKGERAKRKIKPAPDARTS